MDLPNFARMMIPGLTAGSPAAAARSLLIAAVYSLLLLPDSVFGDEIYSWTDSSGRVHFSTEPQNSEAVPADLPELRKENLDQRIEEIRNQTPSNCVKHGGVDCSKGADADGSVICFDGNRDAILPFRFYCVAVRLEARFLVQYEGDKEPSPHRKKIPPEDRFRRLTSFHLTVRNLSAAKARGIEAKFEIPADRKIKLQAAGPAEVEPFGLADYSVSLGPLAGSINARQIEQSRWRLRCDNCAAVLTARQTAN